jgi:hypothetical protein
MNFLIVRMQCGAEELREAVQVEGRKDSMPSAPVNTRYLSLKISMNSYT